MGVLLQAAQSEGMNGAECVLAIVGLLFFLFVVSAVAQGVDELPRGD